MDQIIKSNRSYIWIAVIAVVLVAAGSFYYYHKADTSAVSVASTITINSCGSVSPQNVTVSDGATVAFDNTDKTEHVISIGGSSVTVPAGGAADLVAKLQYGPGTYGYTCDSQLTNNLIVLVPVPGSALMGSTSFKDIYDAESSSVQSCLKTALSSEFDRSYNDVNYIPSTQAMGRVDSCLGPSVSATSSASNNAK